MNTYISSLRLSGGLALAATCGFGAAYAQAVVRPDAGALMQQIEQGQELQLPKVKGNAVVPLPEMKPVAGMAITVSSFRFAGNTQISEALLQTAVAPWLNRPIGFEELQKAAAAVAAVYRDAGWIVRAYLPKQEIENGVVTIQIIQAVLGRVHIERADKVRVSDQTIRGVILAAQPAGQILNADAIDRALLVADDLPGVSVQGLLEEGRSNGETDLLVKLEPEHLLGGDAGLDNAGALSTGATRVTGSLNGNSLLGLGDVSGINLVHTEGSDYLRAAWSLPVGYSGLRMGVSHSDLNYKVITADFASLGLTGRSSSTGVDASYPLIRSRSSNLYLSLNLDHKASLNASNGSTISDYFVDVLSTSLSGNRFDDLGGGGSTSASLALASGNVNLDGSPNFQADDNGPQTHGSYQVLRYSLRRQQVVSSSVYFTGAFTGQAANKNLDSSEKFYLGGMNGVRAYPASEAGGSDGSMVNLELHFTLPLNLSLGAFYDWGQVTVNHNNDIPGAAVVNNASLQGAGLSLGWTSSFGASVRLIWARRLGSNPLASANTGNDQDGTLELNRVWLQASLPF